MAKLSKEEAVKAVQGIEDAEVYVFTAKEHTELLDNFKKATIESELKSRIAKVYDDVDTDFTSATGLKKPDDVKTYKFWPDKVKEYKEKAELAVAEAEKLKTGGNPDHLKEIEALRKAAIEKDNDWKQRFDAAQKEISVRDIKGHLDSSTRDLKLTNLPKPVIDTFIEAAKSKLAASAKIVDGQIQFIGPDGLPLTNKETFKPFTAAELMAVELEPIIEKGINNKGGGTEKPTISKGKDGKIDVALIIPQSVSNRIELTKFLIEAGLPAGTPEHNAAYDKFSENLAVK